MVQQMIPVGGDEGGQEDVFGDGGAVNAGGGGERDFGVAQDGMIGKEVEAGGVEVNKFCDGG